MKILSMLSLCLLFIACGPSHLENTDIETQVLSETGILNKVNLGDDWEDVKKLAGDYWEITEEQSFNLYQFRKDINLSDENMFVTFHLANNKVAGVSISISSKHIVQSALMIYAVDLIALYKNKFGIDLENENGAENSFMEKTYHYSLIKNLDANAPNIQVLCFDTSS